MKKQAWFIIGLAIALLPSCKEDDIIPPEEEETGSVTISFSHFVNADPLQIDTMLYVNAAGNFYQINEIQYFISDVALIASDNSEVLIVGDDIHYVDSDIPSTMEWIVPDAINTGNYKAVRFTFGISQAKNISYMFVNPPERDMFWPEFLGGGYHYLKLNGKWEDTTAQVVPFNFHIGIGQIYDINDSITGFVHNYFISTMQDTTFSIVKDGVTHLEFRMDINSWFETPNVWNHNVWNGYIMQNQAAMQAAKENGFDVFSLHLH